MNAGGVDMLRGSTLYVALFPCNECCKALIQAGVRCVVYTHDYYHNTAACRASRIMFQMAGVELRQYSPSIPTLRLTL
jgi:dCMP deaminase